MVKGEPQRKTENVSGRVGENPTAHEGAEKRRRSCVVFRWKNPPLQNKTKQMGGVELMRET